MIKVILTALFSFTAVLCMEQSSKTNPSPSMRHLLTELEQSMHTIQESERSSESFQTLLSMAKLLAIKDELVPPTERPATNDNLLTFCAPQWLVKTSAEKKIIVSHYEKKPIFNEAGAVKTPGYNELVIIEHATYRILDKHILSKPINGFSVSGTTVTIRYSDKQDAKFSLLDSYHKIGQELFNKPIKTKDEEHIFSVYGNEIFILDSSFVILTKTQLKNANDIIDFSITKDKKAIFLHTDGTQSCYALKY